MKRREFVKMAPFIPMGVSATVKKLSNTNQSYDNLFSETHNLLREYAEQRTEEELKLMSDAPRSGSCYYFVMEHPKQPGVFVGLKTTQDPTEYSMSRYGIVKLNPKISVSRRMREFIDDEHYYSKKYVENASIDGGAWGLLEFIVTNIMKDLLVEGGIITDYRSDGLNRKTEKDYTGRETGKMFPPMGDFIIYREYGENNVKSPDLLAKLNQSDFNRFTEMGNDIVKTINTELKRRLE